MRIKPNEVSQARRFSTGIERVDDSLIERYRQGADGYEQHLDTIADEEPVVPLEVVMRGEIDRAFDAALREWPRRDRRGVRVHSDELPDLLETGLGR